MTDQQTIQQRLVIVLQTAQVNMPARIGGFSPAGRLATLQLLGQGLYMRW